MRRTLRVLIGCVTLTTLGGCSPTVRLPHLLHPGTAGYQRHNAEQFDPYPQNDVGPEIVGGRPIDYQIPRSEVERTRQPLPLGQWRMGSR